MTVHQIVAPEGPAGLNGRAKVVKVGNSLGLILSREMLAHLKVAQGDSLFVVESPDGIVLSPYDPSIAAQVEAGKRLMVRYKDTFRALAK